MILLKARGSEYGYTGTHKVEGSKASNKLQENSDCESKFEAAGLRSGKKLVLSGVVILIFNNLIVVVRLCRGWRIICHIGALPI